MYGIAKKLGLPKSTESPDLEGEIWKTHKDFPVYLISNLGRIKNKKRNRVLKTRVHEGYYDCRIPNKYGKNKNPRIHRMVAETFIPNPDNKKQVNHKDGNKLNNNVDNLEWATNKENQIHSVKNGLHKAHGYVILTEEEVHDICRLLEEGKSYRELEEINSRYKRSRTEGIRQRKRWIEVSKKYSW